MKRSLLHTPDGFRDIYDEDCRRKLELEDRIRQVIYSYGYTAIETPCVEFAEVFSGSEGGVSEKELYRFFDRDGATMALRPDFTPSVARSAARYFSWEEPVRLCYLGQTFVNHSSYRGMSKETTQLGAELMGDASCDADAEVLAMVIRSLQAAGLRDFQITVGHAGYFDSLLRHIREESRDGRAALEAGGEETLKQLIRNRNCFGVKSFLEERQISGRWAEAVTKLPELFGGVEVLRSAREMAGGEDAAIDRLTQVYEILKLYGLADRITFDLSMLGSYMYYTGIIFRGYTYGAGDAVVKGGRYDHLLEQFGKEAPSTGFVIVIDHLLEALKQQKIELPSDRQRRRILCTAENRAEAIREAQALREQGVRVELVYR